MTTLKSMHWMNRFKGLRNLVPRPLCAVLGTRLRTAQVENIGRLDKKRKQTQFTKLGYHRSASVENIDWACLWRKILYLDLSIMFIAFGEKQAEIWAFKVPYILHLVPVLLPLEGLEDHRIISGVIVFERCQKSFGHHISSYVTG